MQAVWADYRIIIACESWPGALEYIAWFSGLSNVWGAFSCYLKIQMGTRVVISILYFTSLCALFKSVMSMRLCYTRRCVI